MPSIITRLFRSDHEAMRAAEALELQGFGPGSLSLTRGGGEEAATLAALRRAGLSPEAARAHALWLRDGGTALTVRPPFGRAVTALSVLRRFGSVSTGIADEYAGMVDAAAPFSTSMGWRVLSHDPAPLSRALGLRVLSARQTPRVRLLRTPSPLSRILFLPTLARAAAPLSRLFGLPTLARRAAPLSSAAGLRVLSDDPAPLSRRLGWGTVSRHGETASEWLGLRLISRNPAPLSSLFGLRTVTRDRPER